MNIAYLCYLMCLLSIVSGAIIGIASLWIELEWFHDLAHKGFLTMCILFVASILGAVVTKCLE